MNDEPSPSESNGRQPGGKFGPGNQFSKGNPHARKVQQIRAALFASVKPADIRVAVAKLVEQAVNGDRFALAELLDRTIGKPGPADFEERLSRLEILLEERNAKHE